MEPSFFVDRAQALRRSAIDGGPDRWEECRDLLQRAVDLARRAGEPRALAVSLMALGQIERDRTPGGEAAWRCYHEASMICRNGREPLLLAKALRHMGEVRREGGRPDEALPLYQEALDLYRTNRAPPLDQANTWRGIALAAEGVGDRAAAVAAWEEAEGFYIAEFGRPEGLDASSAPGVLEARRRIEFLRGH